MPAPTPAEQLAFAEVRALLRDYLAVLERAARLKQDEPMRQACVRLAAVVEGENESGRVR